MLALQCAVGVGRSRVVRYDIRSGSQWVAVRCGEFRVLTQMPLFRRSAGYAALAALLLALSALPCPVRAQDGDGLAVERQLIY